MGSPCRAGLFPFDRLWALGSCELSGAIRKEPPAHLGRVVESSGRALSPSGLELESKHWELSGNNLPWGITLQLRQDELER